MKRLLLMVAAVFAMVMALAGCSSPAAAPEKSEPVFMPTKIVGYSKIGNTKREITTEYEYDSNGNLAKVSQFMSEGESANATIDVYTLNYSSDGTPSSVTHTQSNNKNDIFVGEKDVTVEQDPEGRYTKIEKDGCGSELTYDENGSPTSIERFWSGLSPISYTLDENGFVESANSNPKRDSAGRVISDEYAAGLTGKKVIRAYTYDENGNVTSISYNSAKAYDIEYAEIESASTATKAFAKIKYNGDSPFWDVYSGQNR